MTSLLHILNGDTTAALLARTGLPGDRLPFREALISGPAPRDVSADVWRSVRAEHLAAESGSARTDVEAALLAQERALEGFRDYEEVVLWFEHDLFCQANLVYLLSWLAEREPADTRISLVCVGEFPGVRDFRGLGQLAPDQLASLFETRREVGDESLTATVAWSAWRSPEPTAIERLIGHEMPGMPFLKAALGLHLARFPSPRDGLGRIERLALQLVEAGYADFGGLFEAFGEREPGYGLGDVQFRRVFERLKGANEPLLAREDSGDASGARYRLTPAGERVLGGEADHIALNGIDLWLGGVHLRDGASLWRWDPEASRLLQTGQGAPPGH